MWRRCCHCCCQRALVPRALGEVSRTVQPGFLVEQPARIEPPLSASSRRHHAWRSLRSSAQLSLWSWRGSATQRRSGAARVSRRHVDRSARARTRPPLRQARHRGWPGRQGLFQSARGHQRRQSQLAPPQRAARLGSTRAGRLPGRRAARSPASGAIVIPRGRQAVVGLAGRCRKLAGRRQAAGGSGRGLALAFPREGARRPALRNPRVHPQPDGIRPVRPINSRTLLRSVRVAVSPPVRR
jgi:hypothetical protein